MNVEIGAEAALFPEKEYIKGIFVAVQCPKCSTGLSPRRFSMRPPGNLWPLILPKVQHLFPEDSFGLYHPAEASNKSGPRFFVLWLENGPGWRPLASDLIEVQHGDPKGSLTSDSVQPKCPKVSTGLWAGTVTRWTGLWRGRQTSSIRIPRVLFSAVTSKRFSIGILNGSLRPWPDSLRFPRFTGL